MSDRAFYVIALVVIVTVLAIAFLSPPPIKITIEDKQAAKRYARKLCGNTPLQVWFYDYFEYYVTCDVRSPEVSLRFRDIPDEFYKRVQS